MEAIELLKITEESQFTIEQILENCIKRAEKGYCDFILFGYLSTERISQLANLGYRIEKQSSPIYETIYRISWI